MVEIESLSKQLAEALILKGWSITTAESCTGGGVSQAITALAGSSGYFNCAFVTYSNKAKQQLVGVKAETLDSYGAVSEQTVIEMAQGALKVAESQVSVAISGIAGPGGGTTDKPVGTVWIAVFIQYLINKSTVNVSETERYCFNGDRHSVQEQAVKAALSMSFEQVSKIK